MRFEVETDDRWLDWGEVSQETVSILGSVVVHVSSPRGGLVGLASLCVSVTVDSWAER